MELILKFLDRALEWLFSGGAAIEDISKQNNVIYHLRVPNDALGIIECHGAFYETNSRSSLPNNTLEILKELSCSNEWHWQGRMYFTTHDWVTTFNSEKPLKYFKAHVREIQQILETHKLIT